MLDRVKSIIRYSAGKGQLSNPPLLEQIYFLLDGGSKQKFTERKGKRCNLVRENYMQMLVVKVLIVSLIKIAGTMNATLQKS